MNNPYAPHQCPRCFGLFKVGDRFWNDSGTVYHWSCWVNKRKEKNTAIDLAKAAPPKREWVGLTDEDRYKAIRPLYNSDENARLAVEHSNDEYEAIEAKLKEKNT